MPISREQALEVLDRFDREMDERLKTAQSEVERLQAELADAKRIRVAIIEEAIAKNWPQARVGRSLGTTRQRVAQLRVEVIRRGQ
jgi:uncharacterized small protein (DUF1192 family)